MSQFGGIQQIGQTAFNPVAAPVETYVVPIAGQPLAGNNLQQIAEALAPLSPALNRFAMAVTEVDREQAALEGAAMDFSTVKLTEDIESNERAFRDLIAETGSPNAANPYFIIGARKAYGRHVARQYESEVLSMKDTITDPFNGPDYATAVAGVRQKYAAQLGDNIYSSSEFGLAAQEIDGRMSRRLFEERSAKMEKFYVEEMKTTLGNELQGLREFGKTPEAIERISNLGNELWKKGIDFGDVLTQTIQTIFDNPDTTQEDIDEIMAELPDVMVGKAKVGQNAAMMAQFASLEQRAKRSKLERADMEMKKIDAKIDDFVVSVLQPSNFFNDIASPANNPHEMVKPAVDRYVEAEKAKGAEADPGVVAAMETRLRGVADEEIRRRASVSQASETLRNNESEQALDRLKKGQEDPTTALTRMTPKHQEIAAAYLSLSKEVALFDDLSSKRLLGPMVQKYANVRDQDTIVGSWDTYSREQWDAFLPSLRSVEPVLREQKVREFMDKTWSDWRTEYDSNNKEALAQAADIKSATEELSKYMLDVQQDPTKFDPNKASAILQRIPATVKDRDQLAREMFLADEQQAAATLVSRMDSQVAVLAQAFNNNMAQQADVTAMVGRWREYMSPSRQDELVQQTRGLARPQREKAIVDAINQEYIKFQQMLVSERMSEDAKAAAGPVLDFARAITDPAQASTQEQRLELTKKTREQVRKSAADNLEKLGFKQEWVDRPQLLAEELKKNRSVATDSGALSPKAAAYVYRQIRNKEGYSPVDLEAKANGQPDQFGIKFEGLGPNPWETSFARNSSELDQLQQLGFAAANKAFPNAITSEEQFAEWLEVQRQLIPLRDLLRRPRAPR